MSPDYLTHIRNKSSIHSYLCSISGTLLILLQGAIVLLVCCWIVLIHEIKHTLFGKLLIGVINISHQWMSMRVAAIQL
jgi:hypothetical protein